MATKADLLALVAELQDGDTVNFKAVGDIPAGTVVDFAAAISVQKGSYTRTPSGGDTVVAYQVGTLTQA